MKEILIKQIEFENWANTKLLASMRQAKPLDDRALLLFSHIQSASSMWLNRVKGEALGTTLFQERTLQECEALMKENTRLWLAYLQAASNDELNRVVEFIFPIDGSKRKMAVKDAIFHVVHHSSYHRGQIVTKLKGSVEPLPLVTYIVYASEMVS
jgi:uncharacterized damage-inducible protein DinB